MESLFLDLINVVGHELIIWAVIKFADNRLTYYQQNRKQRKVKKPITKKRTRM